MKKFAKLLTTLMLALMIALTACVAIGCGDDNKNDGGGEWDGRTFEVYVYLADGTTPVKDVRLAICYNADAESSNCLNPVKTDANGKATLTIPENITFVGSPILHFYRESDLPDGYALPSNMTRIEMNDGSAYDHAYSCTTKVIKFNLTVAEA